MALSVMAAERTILYLIMHSKSICGVWEQNCRIQNGVVCAGWWSVGVSWYARTIFDGLCYFIIQPAIMTRCWPFWKRYAVADFENNYKNKIMAYFGERLKRSGKSISSGIDLCCGCFERGKRTAQRSTKSGVSWNISGDDWRTDRNRSSVWANWSFAGWEPSIMMWKPWRLILKSLLLPRQPIRFSRRKTIWGSGANSFVYVLPSDRYCRKPWMFSAGYGILLPSGAESRCRFTNMYWHRKILPARLLKRLFGNGSTEYFTAQTGRRRAVCWIYCSAYQYNFR